MPVPAAVSRNSSRWVAYFRRNADCPDFPWDDSYRLTPEERRAVIASMQQFQLGEGAQGRGFLRRAEAYARRSGDAEFVNALRLFIAEEQRHSANLARFLEQQGIPLLGSQWVDTVFRRLRKLAGLEVCTRVLVVAELIAFPYYRALHNATASPLLRAICRRILRDEVFHVRFQASTLARVSVHHPGALRGMARLLTLWLLIGAVAVVWFEHRPVFRRGGYTPARFLRECLLRFRWLNREIEAARIELQASPVGQGQLPGAPFRREPHATHFRHSPPVG